MKQIIRLTESDLHRVVKESVNRILGELKGFTYDPTDGRYYDKWGNEPEYDEDTGEPFDPYEYEGEDYLGNSV